MKQMEKAIGYLKEGWALPKSATHRGKETFFKLACSFKEIAPLDKVINPSKIPGDLLEFWHLCDGATLFADNEYGQWGLEIWGSREAIKKTETAYYERPKEFNNGDLIIGRFIGDSDLLVIRCDKQKKDYGSILIALPIDQRKDWPVVATDFAAFLEMYSHYEGDKYWE